MTSTPLNSLWLDFSNLQYPGLLWQVGVLIFCLAAGWGMSLALTRLFAQQDVKIGVLGLKAERFSRVLSPVLALVFLVLAKPLLALWYHVNLLRVAIPLVTSFVLIRLAFYVLRRIFARGGKVGSVLLLFEKLFATLVWLGVAIYITGLWPDLVDYLEEFVIPVGRKKISLLVVSQAAVSVIVTVILALWLGASLEERIMQLDTVHSSMRAVMARVGRALLILIAVLVSLSLVGIDLTVLSVFGGALGVGIGLGLQKIASSYVSGFVILLERSLAVGDMVTVDKYYGQVTQIKTRYIILQGLDGVDSVVPNDMLVSSPIQNHSLTNKTLRLATHITVSYQTDIEKVLQLLEQVVASVQRVSHNPAPLAMLSKFGADGFELEIGFWIEDPENGRMNVISEVNRAMWKTLQIHNVSIPYPQREVRIIGEQSV